MKDIEQSFLGTGWSFPPTFSRSNDSVQMVSDEQDIRESLWILFSTSIGERIMVPEYGCQLWKLVFADINTTLTTQIKELVYRAILNWEPRISVDHINVESKASVDGLVLISVDYTIRKTNTRSNLVYPFYTQEGTIPVQVS